MIPDPAIRAKMTVREVFEAWRGGNSLKWGDVCGRLGFSRQALGQMLRYHEDPDSPTTRPPSPTLIARVRNFTGGWEMPGALPRKPRPPKPKVPKFSTTPGKGVHPLKTDPDRDPTVAAGVGVLPGEDLVTAAKTQDQVTDEERAAILAAAAGRTP